MCIWQSGWGCVIGDRRIDGYLYDELGFYRLEWEEMWLKGSSEEEEKKADQGIKRFFWNWTPDLRVGVCRWGGIPPLLLKPPVPPQLRVLPWRWGERPAHLLKKKGGVFWHELRSKCCSLFRVHSSLCRWLCLLEFGPSVWFFFPPYIHAAKFQGLYFCFPEGFFFYSCQQTFSVSFLTDGFVSGVVCL